MRVDLIVQQSERLAQILRARISPRAIRELTLRNNPEESKLCARVVVCARDANYLFD